MLLADPGQLQPRKRVRCQLLALLALAGGTSEAMCQTAEPSSDMVMSQCSFVQSLSVDCSTMVM